MVEAAISEHRLDQTQEDDAQVSPTSSNGEHELVGVVVHGMGEQKHGSTLRSVAVEFCELIRTCLDTKASITTKPLDEKDPIETTIRFQDPSNAEAWYKLTLIEVWWQQAFHPLAFEGFVRGLAGFMRTFFRKNGLKLWKLLPPRKEFLNVTFWQRFIVDILIAFLALPMLVLALLVWVLESLGPLKSIFPKWLAGPQRWLVDIATRTLGDVWVYFREPWEASQIRTRFEQRFNQSLAIGDHRSSAVFVIAHSLGAVVAFEAMSGERMSKQIADEFKDRPNGDQPKLYLFTVGSALNSAWDFAPASETGRFHRKLPTEVSWTNIFATHDPVARGELVLPTEVQAGAKPESKPVHNQMDIFSDHSAYWSNVQEVIAPILSKMAPRLAPYLKLDVEKRRKRVNILAFWKLLAWLIFPAALLLGFGDAVFDPLPAPQEVFTSSRIPEPLESLASALDGVATFIDAAGYSLVFKTLFWAMISAGIGTIIYSSAVKAIWNGFEQRGRFKRSVLP